MPSASPGAISYRFAANRTGIAVDLQPGKLGTFFQAMEIAKTIFVIVALLLLANSAVLASLQKDFPEELRPAAYRWQTATFLVAIGCGAWAFAGPVPVPIVIAIGNSVLTAALAYYHWAIERFYGDRPCALVAIVAMLCALVCAWFSLVDQNFILRLIVLATSWTIILSLTARLLHRHSATDTSRSRRILTIICLSVVACTVVRAILFVGHGSPAELLLLPVIEATDIAFAFMIVLLPVLGTTVFTLMCLEHMHRQLEVAATTDHLTALANRRTFETNGEIFFARARERHGRFAVIVFDLDDFKMVNDTFGHAVGDQVLIFTAAHLRAAMREDDVVARIGGEEFVLLLDDVDEAAAVAAAERIRAAITFEPCDVGSVRVPVAVSAGVAVYQTGDPDFGMVVKRADRALYAAKTAGRNRVEPASRCSPAGDPRLRLAG